jgi:hypothetical protein
MTAVAAWILHPEAGPSAGPLEHWLAAERRGLAERHRVRFLRAGATSARVVAGPPDDTSFGARIRALVAAERPDGAVILGSGAIPLATVADLRRFVEVAGCGRRLALANNRYSADAVAIGSAAALLDLPDLPADNALPRWLAEVAGFEVADLRRRWRLGIDVDGPLDLVLAGGERGAEAADRAGIDLVTVTDRVAAVAAVAGDRRAELLVAGRTSAATLAWLERAIPARVRALVEERGMRAASHLAQAGAGGTARAARPPSSVLGIVLDRDGPASLGTHVARLADAAILDTRVLLAHRFGPDARSWPLAEDRFASDLLLADRIADPWLRSLTAAAGGAPVPILLGGHTLVGPGLRLALGGAGWS